MKKKLEIRKEVVAKLDKDGMNRIGGGGASDGPDFCFKTNGPESCYYCDSQPSYCPCEVISEMLTCEDVDLCAASQPFY